MKTNIAKNSQGMSRHFLWTNKVSNEEEHTKQIPTFNPSSNPTDRHNNKNPDKVAPPATKKKLQAIAVSRWQSVLTSFSKNRSHQPTLGPKPRVIGTLFGTRGGHVHFAFQRDPHSKPAFLVELATPITGLVKEMASGLVRIALECDKEEEKTGIRLLEEPIWRTYCNGKKYGIGTRRECGPTDLKVLKAVEPISMGAGVLPGEIMYMRAKFERVVGSRDSEAFYMMNPDSNGAPELSIYLLRL